MTGAGYVGSHTAKALHARGIVPVVFDNLSSGYREAVRWGPFEYGDIRDTAAVISAIEKHSISAVIHFAGLIEVGRSVARPDLFWDVNVIGTLRLLEAVKLTRTPRVVFSSSAAVYGHTDLARISEAAPKHPASPYGDTKLAGERMIEAQCAAYGLTGFALRYFNAAGADTGALIGEAHEPETHLIPLAIAAALDQSRALTVFGDDFATPDGTCLRDYVHVNDLAAAHVAAVLAKRPAGSFEALNLGTGVGHSVREVIAAVQAALGRDISFSRGPRRTGDPPILVADPSLAQQNLGWKAEHSGLDEIVRDAMRWEAAPAYGVGRRPPRATGLAAVAA
ncbi:MAG: UDP-glucose 4-epimerase GalE [Hyphomonadaceae bacterium]|nr:UDP-glucose 4-epimerase GalE [Hyphomonadaceae bacterium]